MSKNYHGIKRFAPVVGGFTVVGALGYGGYLFVQGMGGVQTPAQPEIQQISLVMPPPPPPPPPVAEPPPEPELVEIEEPEAEALDPAESDEPAPGEDLGLDAEGVAGSDAFGLKAKKGGRGLIGGGDANKWYAGLVQKDLQAALAAIEEIRRGRYIVIIKIWLSADGMIEDIELVRGSGNRDVDQALTAALGSGLRVSREPPPDLPQPIRLRISSRT